MLTTPFAVKGKTQDYKIFLSTAPVFLFFAECSITTITLDPHATKSMAPPIPLTNLPGMIQLAISQVWLTWRDPKIVKSRCPPRIIEKDWAEENNDPPGKIVTVSLKLKIKILFLHWSSQHQHFEQLDMGQRQKYHFNFEDWFKYLLGELQATKLEFRYPSWYSYHCLLIWLLFS